jgi:hypothetical protein
MQDLVLNLRRSGTTTLIVHHSGKGGQQRGTSRREDVLDTVISLRRPDGYDPTEGARSEVHYEKSRGFTGADAIPFEASLLIGEHGRIEWHTCWNLPIGRFVRLIPSPISTTTAAGSLATLLWFWPMREQWRQARNRK